MKLITTFVFFVFAIVVSAQKISLVVPSGHAKNIDMLTATPDGRYMASMSNKTMLVWDVANKKKLHEINFEISLFASEINAVSITNDLGKALAATNSGLFCYNIQTKKQLFNDGSTKSGAIFDAIGAKIYCIDYGTLQTLDATTGKMLSQTYNTVSNKGRKCKLYLLENNRILVLHRFGWTLFNLATKKAENTKEFDYNTAQFESFDYSAKDDLIIAFSQSKLQLIKPATGETVKQLPLAYEPYSIAAGNNHDAIVFGNNYKLQKLKTEVFTIPDLKLSISASQPAAEVPQSIYYATTSTVLGQSGSVAYNNDKNIFFLDTKSGAFANAFNNRITDFKHYFFSANTSQQLITDNHLWMATEDNSFREFNMESYRPASVVPAVSDAIVSTSGKMLAGINKKISLFNRQTGKLIKTLTVPAGVDYQTEFFFFNADDSKLMYTERMKGFLNAIDINTGVSSRFASVGGVFYHCSASFDGKYFAAMPAVNSVEMLRVMNLQTKQVVFSRKQCEGSNAKQCIMDIQFLNDSHLLFAGMQEDYSAIFNIDEPAKSTVFGIQHYNLFKVLGGDIKNNLIAIGEVGQFQLGTHNLKLINSEGKLLREINSVDHNDFLKASFSPDGKLMFTPGAQKGVQAWDTKTGELLGTYYFVEKTNEYVFVSPDGMFDGSEEGMKELYFVKNNKPVTLDKLYEQFYVPDLLRRKVNGEKFTPPDIDNLHGAPKVKISYAGVQRNLEVADDVPAYNNTTGTAEITVRAIADGDDVVDEIRLFHNGKAVNLATRNLFVTDDKSNESVKKYTIDLLPGRNSFRAVALNGQRTESSPDIIEVNYQTNANTIANNIAKVETGELAAVDRSATLHLVVVGIDKYANPAMALNYAMADATAFKEELETGAKTVIDHVQTYFVTDDQANHAGIIEAFKQVQKAAKAQDVFVFYYAGHGVIGTDKEFYLVPQDVSDLKNVQSELQQKGIASKLLQQYAVNIQAQKQLFVLDACQSAGAFAAMLSNDGNQQRNLAVVARSTGTHWIAASGAQQFANEFAQLGHGAFTYVLLQALKGQAASNKMITVNGLKNYLQVNVPELMKKYNGTQQYPASFGFGNDFPVELLK